MSDTQWIDASAVDEVPEDDVIGVMVDGRDIAMYNAGGEIFATDNIVGGQVLGRQGVDPVVHGGLRSGR